MMKKTIFAVLVLISNMVFSKNHEKFIGFKVSNGRTVFNYRYTYNGVKDNNKQKLFFSGVYFNYGGTIKNFTIYSGLGYNLYQFKYDDFVFEDNFNGTGFVPEKNPRQNYSLITIPLNVDYNVNLYKQK